MKVSLCGLDEKRQYYVLIDLVLADDCRYKYTGKEWTVAGTAEPQMPSRLEEDGGGGGGEGKFFALTRFVRVRRYFIHPDSPATGAQWMKHDISFQKVKLTNNNLDQNGHVSSALLLLTKRSAAKMEELSHLGIPPTIYLARGGG